MSKKVGAVEEPEIVDEEDEESDDYDDIEVKGYILRNPWCTDGCACILC